MKRFVALITCLALLRAAAWAQQPPPASPQQQPPSAYRFTPRAEVAFDPEALYRSGRRQQSVGVLLTVLGIGLGLLGFALLYDSKHNDDFGDALGEVLLGGLFTTMGGGSFITGVVLWVNGSNKMGDAREMGASGTSVGPLPRVAAAPGVSWTIRF